MRGSRKCEEYSAMGGCASGVEEWKEYEKCVEGLLESSGGEA